MTKSKLLRVITLGQAWVAAVAILGLAIPMTFGPTPQEFLLAIYVCGACTCALVCLHVLRCHVKDQP